MNREAEKHLDKADDYLGKGDGWYRKAANEIVAALNADPTLSQREVGERFKRSRAWVRDMVTFATTGLPEATSPAWTRGSHATTAEIKAGAEKLLAEAPLEQVERMISELPEDRRLAVAAAAGSGYAAERMAENERVAGLTPAEKKEIEAAKGAISAPIEKALGGFTALGVVGHLEQATEDLAEMIANDAVSPESIYRIEQAHALFVTELEVAKATAGLGEESIV
jgi:hypothetical protein